VIGRPSWQICLANRLPGNGGQLSLGESLAAGAGHARSHDPLNDEVAGDIFQLFGDIFAELLERTTTVAAGVAGRQYLFLAFEVVRQRCAIVGALGRGDLIGIAFGRVLLRFAGCGNLGVFLKIESQLIHGLGFGAKTGFAMRGQLLLQLLYLIGLRLDLCRHQLTDSAQLSRVFRQGFEGRMHALFIPEQPAERNSKHAKTSYFIGLSSLQWPPCSLRYLLPDR